jgi:hypothetical protein
MQRAILSTTKTWFLENMNIFEQGILPISFSALMDWSCKIAEIAEGCPAPDFDVLGFWNLRAFEFDIRNPVLAFEVRVQQRPLESI